jgi:hypothetical protein
MSLLVRIISSCCLFIIFPGNASMRFKFHCPQNEYKTESLLGERLISRHDSTLVFDKTRVLSVGFQLIFSFPVGPNWPGLNGAIPGFRMSNFVGVNAEGPSIQSLVNVLFPLVWLGFCDLAY